MGDDSSDDEEELGTLSSLDHVKIFLINSKAFDVLRLGICHLGRKIEHIVVEMDSSLTTVEMREEPKAHALTAGGSISTDKLEETHTTDHEGNLETLEEKPATYPLQLPEVNKEQEQELIKSHRDSSQPTALLQIIHHFVFRFLRPKVRKGYTRLEWHCVSLLQSSLTR